MAVPMMKAALISFTPMTIASIPNVIVFQTNPESIVHTWTAAASNQTQDTSKAGGSGAEHVVYSPLAVSGPPGETFAFTLVLDSNDDIADASTNPVSAGIAIASGVYARLAALELLQFPIDTTQTVVGQVSAAAAAAVQGASSSQTQTVQERDVPVALFVWGPLRIVPVRVTALTISEKLYDQLLNPSHAEAQITLRVLTEDEVKAVQGPMRNVASTANQFMKDRRSQLASSNFGNSIASILGMLPTPL